MASNELVLLSGNAHPELAEAVANALEIERLDATIGSFPDEETSVQLDGTVRGQDVFILQPTGPPANHNVMELLILSDALRRASAARITAVIPYYGYARQDRKDRSRAPITGKLVTDMYQTAGVNRLLAVDLHAAQIQGFTNIPFDHLYAARTITNGLCEEIERPVVVAPDVGAGKMADDYARLLGTPDIAIIIKERLDGRRTRVTGMIGASVMGRTALLVDDIVSTGGSLLNAAKALKRQGAESVVAAATHGVLCGSAIEQVASSLYLDRLYVTDSLPARTHTEKIRRITIAPLLAAAVRNIHNGESVSSLFS